MNFRRLAGSGKGGGWLFAAPNRQMVRAQIAAQVGDKFEIAERRNGEDAARILRDSYATTGLVRMAAIAQPSGSSPVDYAR